MSEGMVERVARAIGVSLAPILNGLDGAGGVVDLAPVARAALETMRSPTDEMYNAAGFGANTRGRSSQSDAWRAMIDTALSQPLNTVEGED